jgi:hypothetical protein
MGNAGLQNVEGKALGALGITAGKLGTRSNPIYTKSVDGNGGGGSGSTSGTSTGNSPMDVLGRMLHIGGSGVGGSDLSSFVHGAFNSGITDSGSTTQSLAKTLFSGLGFAAGGDPPVGMASIVGENGPELFVPKRAGTVVPNGKWGATQVHNHNFQGANFSHTDPQMVQKQIMAAAPGIAAGAVKAVYENKARIPTSRSR